MEEGFQTVNLHGCASGVIATPVIGQNGNWYIGNKDTKVSAKGETGEAGVDGAQGVQGPKGEQGDIGETGAQGIQGIQGEKGEIGDVGPAGPQGIQGVQGEKGDKGETGAQGEIGPKGEQGVKGEDADESELIRLNNEVVKVNDSLNAGNLDFDYIANDGLYYEVKVGADTVRKKCSGVVNSISLTFQGEMWYTNSESYGAFYQDVNVQGYKTLNRNMSILTKIATLSLVGHRANGGTVLLSNSTGNLSNIDISNYVKVSLSAYASADKSQIAGVFVLNA